MMGIFQLSAPNGYDLTKITVPTAMFWSSDDTVTPPAAMKKIYETFSNKTCYYKVNENVKFNHADYIWAKKASEIVYAKVVAFDAQPRNSFKCL